MRIRTRRRWRKQVKRMMSNRHRNGIGFSKRVRIRSASSPRRGAESIVTTSTNTRREKMSWREEYERAKLKIRSAGSQVCVVCTVFSAAFCAAVCDTGSCGWCRKGAALPLPPASAYCQEPEADVSADPAVNAPPLELAVCTLSTPVLLSRRKAKGVDCAAAPPASSASTRQESGSCCAGHIALARRAQSVRLKPARSAERCSAVQQAPGLQCQQAGT